MNAELVFFGKRVSMAPRSRRRVVVVAIYAVLASLVIASSSLSGWRSLSPYVIWAVILACRLFLGGYYPGGLVKPFSGNASRPSDAPPSLLILKLRVYKPVPGVGEAYTNDERELNQRDRAHYLAYKALGMALFVPWVTSSLLGDQRLFSLNPATVNRLCSAIILGLIAMFITLPQAILLWTEPDMEPEAEIAN
jgi:hypothetical protein